MMMMMVRPRYIPTVYIKETTNIPYTMKIDTNDRFFISLPPKILSLMNQFIVSTTNFSTIDGIVLCIQVSTKQRLIASAPRLQSCIENGAVLSARMERNKSRIGDQLYS